MAIYLLAFVTSVQVLKGLLLPVWGQLQNVCTLPGAMLQSIEKNDLYFDNQLKPIYHVWLIDEFIY